MRLEIEAGKIELDALEEQIRRANLALMARREIVSGVLDALSLAVLVLGPGLRVVEANPTFWRQFQLSSADLLGHPLGHAGQGLWHWEGVLQALRRTETDGEEINRREFEADLGPLGPSVLSVSARRLSDHGRNAGEPLVVCSFDDVTERKRVQSAMQTQLEHLGGTSTGLAIVDRSLRVRYVNPALESLRGAAAADLINHRLACLPEAAQSLLRRESGSGEAELPYAQGQARPVRWSTSPMPDGGGVLEVRDVSQERRMAQSLLESEKLAATGRLAATLAHEINNPLGVVNNTLYLLEEMTQLEPGARKLVQSAAGEVTRMRQIIHSTLSLYRTTATLDPVNPNHALASALEVLHGRIQEKHLQVRTRLDARTRPVMVGGELRQMLVNLVDNAAAAAPEGGQLWLAARDTGGDRPGVRLLVADNGPGIPPAARARLFRPFATSKGPHGTGLGLWVTAEIARKYQGSVRCKSWHTAPTGTCFAIFLPTAA